MSLRVLVVDDTEHVRSMLVEMLDLDGFEVVGDASSGEEAIRQATEKDPHVIVMDHKMPGMDGLEAAEKIRAARSDQAIILYTAYLDPEIEAQAKRSGVALCVGKVDGLPALERNIRELCRDLTNPRQQTFNI